MLSKDGNTWQVCTASATTPRPRNNVCQHWRITPEVHFHHLHDFLGHRCLCHCAKDSSIKHPWHLTAPEALHNAVGLGGHWIGARVLNLQPVVSGHDEGSVRVLGTNLDHSTPGAHDVTRADHKNTGSTRTKELVPAGKL